MYIQGGARDINKPDDLSDSFFNIHLKIPDNTAFVVFGGMPSSDGAAPGTADQHTDNVFITSWMMEEHRLDHPWHAFAR